MPLPALATRKSRPGFRRVFSGSFRLPEPAGAVPPLGGPLAMTKKPCEATSVRKPSALRPL